MIRNSDLMYTLGVCERLLRNGDPIHLDRLAAIRTLVERSASPTLGDLKDLAEKVGCEQSFVLRGQDGLVSFSVSWTVGGDALGGESVGVRGDMIFIAVFERSDGGAVGIEWGRGEVSDG